jgi:hypothetical protein
MKDMYDMNAIIMKDMNMNDMNDMNNMKDMNMKDNVKNQPPPYPLYSNIYPNKISVVAVVAVAVTEITEQNATETPAPSPTTPTPSQSPTPSPPTPPSVFLICDPNPTQNITFANVQNEWETQMLQCGINERCISQTYERMFERDFSLCEYAKIQATIKAITQTTINETNPNCGLLHSCKQACDDMTISWKNIHLNMCYGDCYSCISTHIRNPHISNANNHSNHDNLGLVAFGVFILAFVFYMGCIRESANSSFTTMSVNHSARVPAVRETELSIVSSSSYVLPISPKFNKHNKHNKHNKSNSKLNLSSMVSPPTHKYQHHHSNHTQHKHNHNHNPHVSQTHSL